MDSSWLVLVSIFGAAMAPLWVDCWDAVLRRAGMPKAQRIAGGLVLSLATLLILGGGPWVLISIANGRIAEHLADPWLPLSGLLVLLGPSIVFQLGYVAYLALRSEALPVGGLKR